MFLSVIHSTSTSITLFYPYLFFRSFCASTSIFSFQSSNFVLFDPLFHPMVYSWIGLARSNCNTAWTLPQTKLRFSQPLSSASRTDLQQQSGDPRWMVLPPHSCHFTGATILFALHLAYTHLDWV